MAKRKKQLSVGRILALKPLQLEKMSAKELRQLTTILNSAANKRIKRAQTLGTESSVIEKAIQGGHFRTTRIQAGTPESEARPIAYAEFMRARTFLSKDTSSTRGVKKQQKKIIKKFKQKARKILKTEPGQEPFKVSPGIDEGTLNGLVWSQVDKLAESRPLTREERYRAAGAAYEIMIQDMKTDDELFNYLTTWADNEYIDSVENMQDVGDEEIAALFKGYDGI